MKFFFDPRCSCEDLVTSYRQHPVRVEIYYFPSELQLFVNRAEGTEFHTYAFDGRTARVDHVSTDFPCDRLSVSDILPDLSDRLRMRRKDHYLPAIEQLARLDAQ